MGNLLYFCIFAIIICSCRADNPEIIQFESEILKANPLDDPNIRETVVLFPPSIDQSNITGLPVLFWLPGSGTQPSAFTGVEGDEWIYETLLACEMNGSPIVMVAIDAQTHWQCSQYIDSTSTGQYMSYIVDEVVPFIESKYKIGGSIDKRIIGHSSGGFGALRIGIERPDVFGRVIALSPDSDFNVSHLPIVMEKEVMDFPIEKVIELEKNITLPVPGGDVQYILSLSADYSPIAAQPPYFEWPLDNNHQVIPEVWKRWLDNDPYQIVLDHSDALAKSKSVYLDGGYFDEFKAEIGAEKIYKLLDSREIHSNFFMSPGDHGLFLHYRVVRAVLWTFDKL